MSIAATIPLPTLPRTAVRTHCPYCAFQCGMLVTPVDGKLQIAADPDFPVNRGQMCIKGFNSGDLLTSPDRLLQPLKKNDRGGFDDVTWDAALDEIAERIEFIQRHNGRDAIGVFGSGALTNEKAYTLGKFARVALRTANIDYNGRYCMASAAAGQNASFGLDRGMPFPVADIAETKCCVLWGSNLADTLPPIMQYFHELKANGGLLVVIDPRLTETARLADVHIQPVPGADLLLANGLLHLAIEEDLIDLQYIAERTSGWDAVRSVTLRYHPAYVERATGVPVEQLRRVVRALASGPSMILSGRGPEQQSKGSDSICAMINLMLALGKVGQPASGYGTLTGQGNGQGGREHGQKADQLPGYRLIENEADRKHMAAFWGMAEKDLPRKGKSAVELLNACGDNVKAMLVFGSNLAVGSPNSGGATEKLKSLDLLVVADAFMNETAALADFVLPTLQFAEEEGTMTNLEGRVIRRRRVIDASAGPKSDLAVLEELASRLGEGDRFTFASTEAVFDELARATAGGRADYSGLTYAKLDANDGVCWPCPKAVDGAADHPGTPRLFADRFAHADGRAKFIPVEHRTAGEEPDADYPLYFTTGRYKEHYNSGAQTRRVAALTAAKPRPRVQLHPRLASRLGVGDGDPLRVESRRGEVIFEANVTSEIRADTLFAPFHWGGKQAANVLTNPALDPKSKMPEFKVCAVRASIVALEESEGT
ncbi:MAG: Assimilatory nitrate reductase large subunit [Phycisphaerales bacterium]|nr:Assimilatory nitrate reductase large subunit [Phycisphaerales bacterium]